MPKPEESVVATSTQVRPASSVTPDALYQLGRYYQGSLRYAEAVKAFQGALAADAQFADAHNGLGVVYAEQGRYDEAISEFRAAIELQPALPYLHANMGYAFLLQGKNGEALVALQGAQLLEPGNEKVAEFLALARGRLRDTIDLSAAADRTTSGQEVATMPMSDAEGPSALRDSQLVVTGPAAMTDETALVLAMGELEPAAAVTLEAEQFAAPPPATAPLINSSDVAFATANQTLPGLFDVREADTPTVAEPPPDHEQQLMAALAALQETRAMYGSDFPAPVVAASATETRSARSARVESGERKGAERPSARRQFALEISNGNGVHGLAKSLAIALQKRGLPSRRITNSPGFRQSATEILYRVEYREQAARVKSMLPAQVVLVQSTTLRSDVHVKVVLGRDFRDLQALLPSQISKLAVNGTPGVR
jgi:tetratricopeptide (TPR) repeat protein